MFIFSGYINSKHFLESTITLNISWIYWLHLLNFCGGNYSCFLVHWQHFSFVLIVHCAGCHRIFVIFINFLQYLFTTSTCISSWTKGFRYHLTRIFLSLWCVFYSFYRLYVYLSFIGESIYLDGHICGRCENVSGTILECFEDVLEMFRGRFARTHSIMFCWHSDHVSRTFQRTSQVFWGTSPDVFEHVSNTFPVHFADISTSLAEVPGNFGGLSVFRWFRFADVQSTFRGRVEHVTQMFDHDFRARFADVRSTFRWHFMHFGWRFEQLRAASGRFADVPSIFCGVLQTFRRRVGGVSQNASSTFSRPFEDVKSTPRKHFGHFSSNNNKKIK